MTRYAKFSDPQSDTRFDYAEFKPTCHDYQRLNYQKAKCYYRDGAWYVPEGWGLPRSESDGPPWGDPTPPPMPCAWPKCACIEEVRCASSFSTPPVEVVPVPAVDKSHTPSAYPDGNPKSLQGAKKYDLMYLPLTAEIEVNRALEDGAKKYGKANWRLTGVSATVYLNAAARHIKQYNEGQERASDSGVHNLGHAMACLAIILDAAANGKLIDDRPEACVDTDALLKR